MDFSCEHQRSSRQEALPFDCVTYLTFFTRAWYVLPGHPCISVVFILDQKEFRCNSDTSAELPDILSSNVLILMLVELRTFCFSCRSLVHCINIWYRSNKTTSNVAHGLRT